MRQLDLFSDLETEAPREERGDDEGRAKQDRDAQDRAKQDRGQRGRGARGLAARLNPLLGGELGSLILIDNRTRIVSARRLETALEVRIHRSFVHASDDTLEQVAEFLGGARGRRRSQALEAIRRHFEAHHDPAVPPPHQLEPEGRFFDLREIRDRINKEYFDDELEVEITWGRTPPERRRSRRQRGFSIRLGSYDDRSRLVRVHRSLDRPEVPRCVVESVVHHEMLHAAIPPERGVAGSRRRIHTPEFRRRERHYEHHEVAERWLKENLTRLAGLEK